MQFEDYYKTLGIQRDATADDIKRAYRKLARKHHPDVNKDNPDAAAKFSRISEANEVLSDPEKRKLYDQFGKDWKAGQQMGADDFARYGFGGGQGGRGGGSSRTRGFDFSGGNGQADFSDFFENLFGNRSSNGFGGGNPFGGGGMGGSGRGQTAAPPLQEVAARITLDEAIAGTTRQLNVRGPDGEKTLDIRIPAGVSNGAKIRLQKEGLQLRVEILQHPDFAIDGADLTTVVELTPAQAVLGDKVDLRTPRGQTLTLTIKPGTRTGTRLRIPNQGLPLRKKDQTAKAENGNLIARLEIQPPENPTDQQRTLYEQLRALEVP